MIWDIHAHIGGVGTRRSGNFLAPGFARSLTVRGFLRRLRLSPKVLDAEDCDAQIARSVVAQINASKVNRVVLLALDAAHRDDGSKDEARTRLVADNDFVAGIAAANEKVLFGASVHPSRRDALPELERLIEKGACLVKWLPGAQNIQPDHPRCFPFYDLLARHRIPLLCHTGGEHTLKAFPDSLNDPQRLIPALERGVTVIAAHCGTSLYLHERSYFRNWRAMALRYEGFYGDLSAFGVMTRVWRLRTLRRTPQLMAKCVFGSDFPAAPLPLSCLGPVGLRAALRIRRSANLFDRSLELLRCAGVSREIFERAGTLLRLPEHARPRVVAQEVAP